MRAVDYLFDTNTLSEKHGTQTNVPIGTITATKSITCSVCGCVVIPHPECLATREEMTVTQWAKLRRVMTSTTRAATLGQCRRGRAPCHGTHLDQLACSTIGCRNLMEGLQRRLRRSCHEATCISLTSGGYFLGVDIVLCPANGQAARKLAGAADSRTAPH